MQVFWFFEVIKNVCQDLSIVGLRLKNRDGRCWSIRPDSVIFIEGTHTYTPKIQQATSHVMSLHFCLLHVCVCLVSDGQSGIQYVWSQHENTKRPDGLNGPQHRRRLVFRIY